MKMLVFSGDVDAIVPVIGTRRWINKLELDVKEAWRPYFVDGQVGGYVEVYDGLTLATVRGGGHMVPYTKPARALHLFESFVLGTDL
jgi:serine carboxypeptidase-like clade 2